MSEDCREQHDILKQFAFAIFSDIRKYIDENLEEYEKWLAVENKKN